ncbi:von Willebrand factor C and EGF domain-containing protein-like [Mercenaria mercenaria]|uniref:von Willebrand factor C and EGF domain-containing protein-like n=1 Tax=Mercenaria mercenaria TaxID=6596 RepID=UPI00234F1623|nr:von Willebrand factor C and EGF domain-containing protein-like [Mercenaria mercenaria]
MKKWMLIALLFVVLAYDAVCQSDSDSVQGSNTNDKDSGTGSSMTSSRERTLFFQPKQKCRKFGNDYNINETFIHPMDNCRECTCCETGKVRCLKKKCNIPQPPPCGTEHFEDITPDGCCVDCDAECKDKTCSITSCASGTPHYAANDCCMTCGCYTRGGVVLPSSPAIIDNDIHPACEQCRCQNGELTCENKAACPSPRLQCVDAKINPDTCEWYCPNERTCLRGDTVIKEGEYVTVGDKLCMCYTDGVYWSPVAMCTNKNPMGSLELLLERDMCMKRPTHHSTWTKNY